MTIPLIVANLGDGTREWIALVSGVLLVSIVLRRMW